MPATAALMVHDVESGWQQSLEPECTVIRMSGKPARAAAGLRSTLPM
jgi:hypothetical protein